MRSLINLMLISFLTISAGAFAAAGNPQQQQNEEQNASPQQQEAPPSQGQASSSATAQSVTGCVVQTGNGYSLKTESDTYPIETTKDLSQYVNKRVKITGILEHHNAAAPSSSTGNAATVTDIRLRIVAKVIGDCAQPEK